MENQTEYKPIEKLPAHTEPASLVMAAMQRGYEPAFIEKMMDLSERHERNEARRQYYQAVADFKSDPPEVLKDKENKQFSNQQKKAMYVSLGNLVATVNPALGKHGLSASWDINQAEKIIKVTCKLSHRLGHSESVTMEAPPDTSGGNSKNPIQQIKSTITYLRAATFEAVTGIAAIDESIMDDDGNTAGSEYITIDQATEINDLIKETNSNREKFLKYMKASSVETIMAADYNRAKIALENKRAPRQPGEDG
jgi:hypothetical protein